MNSEPDLQRRIQILEDIEAIKRLKARYWNSVDNKQWEELAGCLAEDFIFDSPHLGRMEGRDHIVKVLKRAMKYVTTAHQGHNPEIDIIDDSTARGRWALNDRVETADQGSLSGYGHYEESYVKQDGVWKIKQSKYSYTFQNARP
ncbi:MAG: nuclear transport factor 2 family protein [Dehalococcoidales bacterium]|nr:nuclear transport factor 2 family protein [Dehalococcoidales bacterium]